MLAYRERTLAHKRCRREVPPVSSDFALSLSAAMPRTRLQREGVENNLDESHRAVPFLHCPWKPSFSSHCAVYPIEAHRAVKKKIGFFGRNGCHQVSSFRSDSYGVPLVFSFLMYKCISVLAFPCCGNRLVTILGQPLLGAGNLFPHPQRAGTGVALGL